MSTESSTGGSEDRVAAGGAAVGAATDAAPEDSSEEGSTELTYTIDELSTLTGVPSRTIRFYQSKGTLPPPERRGRVALYRPEHAERLKVIAELQDRGLRLNAIRDVLQQVERGGDSLHGWLGLGERLQAPWTDDRPLVVDQNEMQRLLSGGQEGQRAHRPGLLAELEGAGVVRREGNSQPATYVIPSPELLNIAVRLDAAGVDVATALGASDILRHRLGAAADELVTYFASQAQRHLSTSAQVNVEELVGTVDVLRNLGSRAVQLIFAQEMERALRSFVESGRVLSSTRPARSGDHEGSTHHRSPRRSRRR